MSVDIRVERDGDRIRVMPAGPFDLAHAMAVHRRWEDVEPRLDEGYPVDVDLADLHRIDGNGAALIARFLYRLDAAGRRTRLERDRNPQAERLVAVYLKARAERPVAPGRLKGMLPRIGAAAAEVPATVRGALEFIGRCAFAVPGAIASPRSVDWRSLPRLLQEIGADALPVTGAANLLVGLIIGFIGVSQLGRFGAVAYVPELVVIAHFRELGPLVTAIVVAGRSGAGLASAIATMKVSEEIDALRSMGFDPVRWLVVPRCLALAATVPLLTWVGDALALIGGLAATV